MATTLAPVDGRQVLRCDACALVQFRAANQRCRRCKTPLEYEGEDGDGPPLAAAYAPTTPFRWQRALSGPSLEEIVEETHRMVDGERIAKGLPPWEWNKVRMKEQPEAKRLRIITILTSHSSPKMRAVALLNWARRKGS